MEKGERAWQMPWHCTGADISRPRNVASRNPYHGINVPALWAAASDKGYQSGWWGSYKQWQEVGGQVRKGEKASPIVFWKKIKKALTDEATGEAVRRRGFSERLMFARALCRFLLHRLRFPRGLE
jgi:antirestriction protein ArdC